MSNLHVDIGDLISQVRALGPNAQKALIRSIRRTSTGAKAQISQAIQETIALKASTVKDAISLTMIKNDRNPEGRITISGKPIPLIEYGARELSGRATKSGKKKGGGVSFRIFKNKGRVTFRHAFIATVGSHQGVFMRGEKGAPRLPIKELKGPAVPNVFENSPGLSDTIMSYIQERLAREFMADLAWRNSQGQSSE